MLESVEVIYCQMEEEGEATFFFHQNLHSPPIKELKVADQKRFKEIQEAKRFIEELVKKAGGYVIEEDPYYEGVFHIFRE